MVYNNQLLYLNSKSILESFIEEEVILIESRFKKFQTSQLWTHQKV